MSARLEQRFPAAFKDCHYGLYVFGEKAGFVRIQTRRDPITDEIHLGFMMEFVVDTDGVISHASISSRKIYSSEAPHDLLFAEDVSNDDGSEERKVFNARGSVGRVGVFAGGTSQMRDGVSTQEQLAPQLEIQTSVARGSPGTQAHFPEFELDRQADQMKTFEFVGVETIDSGGALRELRHVRLVSDNAHDAVDLFLDTDDSVVVIRLGELLEGRLENAVDAQSDLRPFDALLAGKVPLEAFAGDPERLDQLELEWSGVPQLLPERAAQTSHWKIEGERQLVMLNRAAVPTKEQCALPVPEDVRRELRPDSLCNSDHPRIRDLAQEIAGDVRDPWRRVELVVHWLQENMEGGYGANHTTSLAVLDARQGDCTEFTVLASGLLRALGIPTRRVGGVALVADDPGTLHGHAWVEVWIGGWVAVDPTFGQAPADCGHICFGGENDLDFFGVRGMRARVVGSKKRAR